MQTLIKNNKENNKTFKFVNYFYDIKLNKKDKENLNQYLKTMKLNSKNLNAKEISKIINRPKRTIENWLIDRSVPYGAKFFKYFKSLGKPKSKNLKWLSINSTKGGIFTGPWILVPNKVNNYKDILFVINQIKPVPETFKLKNLFNITSKGIEKMRSLFFAYILGMLIGDLSKEPIKIKNRTTRRITLRLTKRYKTNKNVCEFLCLCINSIGLQIKKNKDDSPSKKTIYFMYRYGSQCSQLIQWIFKACFELKDNECTTYNGIKSNWILKTPRDFRIWFLQGIADSDGYIDIGALQIGLITKPNANIIQKIFNSLDIHNSGKNLERGLPAIMISLKDGNMLPIFNPYSKSHRYNLMKKLISAKRPSHHLPKNLGEEINKYIIKGKSSIDIVKIILDKYNLLIRGSSVQKRTKRLERERLYNYDMHFN